MEWLQKIYMWVLNPIFERTSKLPFIVRDRVFFSMMFLLYGLILVWYSINMFGIYFSHTPRMLLECLIFFVAIIFISDKKLEKVKWNNFIACCWIICGLIIFVMGFIAKQNFGYWLIGPVMAFGFPCLYFVLLNQEEYSKYLLIACKAITLVSLIYFVVALFADFFSDTVWDWLARYNGTTSDANRIGEICVATFACSICLLFTQEKNKAWKIISYVVMGFCICDAWISMSRSTLIAISCMLIYYCMLIIKNAVAFKNFKSLLVKSICLICCILAAFSATFMMKAIHGYALDYKGYEDQIHISTSIESVEDRLEADDSGDITETVDSFSSGRITIWGTYLNHVGILGNEADGRTPIEGNITNVSAHNTFLEFSYRSGIVAGFLFLLVEILAGVLLLRVLFRHHKKNRIQDYLVAFASIGYIFVSNLQVAYNPLTSIIFFVYSIAVVVLLEDRNRLFNKKGHKKLA